MNAREDARDVVLARLRARVAAMHDEIREISSVIDFLIGDMADDPLIMTLRPGGLGPSAAVRYGGGLVRTPNGKARET